MANRLILAAAVATCLVVPGAAPGRGEVAQEATIIFVDVGQGDAVVMKIGGSVIVADAGEFKLENVETALERIDATRIDVAILSHPHRDHVKNFVELFAKWEVKKAVLSRSEWWDGPDLNETVIAAIGAEGLKPTYVHAGRTFTWGGASWQVLNPPKGKYTGGEHHASNASIAYLLRVNGVVALFTGDIYPDAADDVATRLASKIDDDPVEIFLATHHGSKYGSTGDLLNVARPKWAVLSTGENDYHHPSPKAIKRLKAIGASIWCTEQNGSITVRISSGGHLNWQASDQAAPWWDATEKKKHGTCVNR
jgi:competence protein ComEC